MNLREFANKGGCKVVLCGPGWGGRYGYTTKDAPNCFECGFKTVAETRQRWLENTFGEGVTSAILELLKQTKERRK